MHLAITPVKQHTENDCWNACLKMVLSYFGTTVADSEMDRFVIKDGRGQSFLTEVARIARSKGFAVDCLAYNLFLTDPIRDENLSQGMLLEKLGHTQSHLRDDWYKPMLDSTIRALESGVRYVIQKPTLDVFASFLDRRIPVVISVNYAALHSRRGDPFQAHEIVLSGHSRGRFWFIDPKHGIEQSITPSDLMFAILQRKIIAASAYLVAVMK